MCRGTHALPKDNDVDHKYFYVCNRMYVPYVHAASYTTPTTTFFFVVYVCTYVLYFYLLLVRRVFSHYIC